MNNYLYTILCLCSINITLCGGGKNKYVPHIQESGIEEGWLDIEETPLTNRVNLNEFVREEEDETTKLTRGTITSRSSSKSKNSSHKKRKNNNQKINQLIGYGIRSNSFERVTEDWNALQMNPNHTQQWAQLTAAAKANAFVKKQQVAEKINSVLPRDIIDAQIELEEALKIKIFLQEKFKQSKKSIERKKLNEQLPITQSTSF